MEKRKLLNIFFTRVEPLMALAFFAAAPVVSPPRDFSPPSLGRALVLALCALWFLLGIRYTRSAEQIYRQRGAEQIHQRGTAIQRTAKTAARRVAFGAALLALLCAFGLAFYALARRFGNEPRRAAFFPAGAQAGAFDFAALCAAMAASAFFEEVFYRAYLPLRAEWLFRRRIVPRVVSVVLFAAAHKNGGHFAVLNALASGAALQYAYEKTGSLLTISTAHTLYNVFALVFFYR